MGKWLLIAQMELKRITATLVLPPCACAPSPLAFANTEPRYRQYQAAQSIGFCISQNTLWAWRAKALAVTSGRVAVVIRFSEGRKATHLMITAKRLLATVSQSITTKINRYGK